MLAFLVDLGTFCIYLYSSLNTSKHIPTVKRSAEVLLKTVQTTHTR